MSDESLKQRLRWWSDELRAVAGEGLMWAGDNPYNARRFQRVLRIAAEIFAAQDTREPLEVERTFNDHLDHVAPWPGAEGAIFDEAGRILLIQRTDNRLWAMPGGMLEVGESPAEGACREVHEETGIEVEPLALSGIYDSRKLRSRTGMHLYLLTFLCRPRDARPEPVITNETLDVRWFGADELPPLSPGHDRRVPDAFARWQGDITETIFDLV
ncbi:MAG TPA: NUDIX hydrolase N-terminal domain-containing protein [Chloroflexota bacterium]|nr:NUDIX hydrolase N-terminal domain-containing protein [Chloroflexota bacterium]